MVLQLHGGAKGSRLPSSSNPVSYEDATLSKASPATTTPPIMPSMYIVEKLETRRGASFGGQTLKGK